MRDLDPFLISIGWNDFFATAFLNLASDRFEPGRVIGQGKGHYQVQIAAKDITEAAITTTFHDSIGDAAGFPTVGDWVVLIRGEGNKQASIHGVLPRKNLIQRQRSGSQQGMQLIAANVDSLLAVTSLNEDFNLERLGRYLALGRDQNCATAVVLTKADLCANPSEFVGKTRAEFENTEVFAISENDLSSMSGLEKFFAPGKTSVLVGSSGVGKSTLTNYLLGFESQKTQGLSGNSRGRHTTSARNLIITRFGGLVMDTPGMQEVATADPQGDLEKSFADLEESMLRCKFTDCQHKSEPGCVILDSIRMGTLSAERWGKYQAMKASQSRKKKRNRY